MGDAVRVALDAGPEGRSPRCTGQYEAVNWRTHRCRFCTDLALLERLRRGEADIVILTREGLDGLAREGSVVADQAMRRTSSNKKGFVIVSKVFIK